MLLRFTVENYLIFREAATLSMEAVARIDKDKAADSVFQQGKYALLKSAAIFGANGSGKSSLIRAMELMQRMIIHSARESQANDEIDVQPFKLSEASRMAPSAFEAEFLIGSDAYRYGFEATRKEIVSEWLYLSELSGREKRLFERERSSIELGKAFAEGKGLAQRTRPNALFISVAAQFNGPVASKVLRWASGMHIISGLDDRHFQVETLELMEQDPAFAERVSQLVRSADTGISGLRISKKPQLPGVRPPEAMEWAVTSIHEPQPDGEMPVEFDLEEESEGTRKFFRMAGPVLRALQEGSILVVDELDARLHPSLVRVLVRLFNFAETNPRNAQLIFATHTTHLLDADMLRRDQIWFTEKSSIFDARLYSLAEFRPEGKAKVRNDAAYERNYLKGRYGGVPELFDFAGPLLDAKQRYDQANPQD
ncbi:MAG: ATP-binding protein [Bacteroidia bacterium]|nr:ATP-binding protein [Bacteroidia bacterium]